MPFLFRLCCYISITVAMYFLFGKMLWILRFEAVPLTSCMVLCLLFIGYFAFLFMEAIHIAFRPSCDMPIMAAVYFLFGKLLLILIF